MSKWSYLDDRIVGLYRNNETLSYSKAARMLIGDDEMTDIDLLRTYIKRFLCKQTKPEAHLSVEEKDNRVLVIGDLHEPFCLEGYLEHCKKIYAKYDCNKVVFIGDVIDNCYSSFHEADPDGMSGGDELDLAVSKLSRWVKEFPDAYVTIGNHDRIISRKAFSGGVPKKWVKTYNEVLSAPDWKFVDSVVMDNVLYIHGEGGTARARMKKELHSLVQGHLHTQGYIEFNVGQNYKIFGMQVGCGINKDSYAMAYGKNFQKPFISCSVVLNNGELPILEPMKL